MSSKPLVPSKDALRLLRCLAYSPPAAFVGAVGALCGVATVQFHERRKVRRAERILETKRRLHTITKGRGSTRLAFMFEAAERGEDFTINKSRRSRGSKPKHYSAIAAPQESDHNLDWKSSSQSYADDVPELSHRERSPDQAIDTIPTSSADADTQIKQEQVTTPRAWMPFVYDRSKNNEIPTSEDLNDDTHTFQNMYNTVNTPVQKRQLKKKHTWDEVREIAGGSVGELPKQISKIMQEMHHFIPLNAEIDSPFKQEATDLNPLKEVTAEGRGLTGRIAPISNVDKGNSILLKSDTSTAFANNGFISLKAWQESSDRVEDIEDTRASSVEHNKDEPSLHIAALDEPGLYLASSALVPSVQVKHQYKSRYDFDNVRVRQGMGVVGSDRYEYVFTRLMNHYHEHGKHAALCLLEQVMVQYTVTEKRSDFALVQALFLDCTRLFETRELKPLIWRYVERFLAGDMPRLEVVSLLYPRCGAGVRSDQQYYYFLAHQYLEMICDQGYSFDRQVTELRKVIAGTRMSNIELHEHLMIPTLRAFCSIGRMTSAQALYDEMKFVHKISTTPYSLQVMTKGYARFGNWNKVKSILDDYQSSGSSKHKTYGLSGLLVTIVKDYSRKQSPEKLFNFVTHSMKAYQIEPYGSMTKEIVVLCLRHRRYDLIASWMRMLRAQFPHIETGTSSGGFAYEISCVWKEMNASVEDILNGCRALTEDSLRDPFSKVVRSSISEAVMRCLSAQVNELRQEVGPEVPRYINSEASSLPRWLEQLQDIADTQVLSSRARLLLAHVLKEGEALRWLNALCRGHTQSVVAPIRRPVDPAQLVQVGEDGQNTKLSELTELQDVLMAKYARENKAGQKIEHDSLRELANQLSEQGRMPHAFELIQSVYDSRWAQSPTGREFDIDLFTDWLHLAWALRSGSKLRYVLWAIVDASPQLQLTAQVLLLARIAAPKTHHQRVKRARTNQLNELEYLRTRLKRRRWAVTSKEKGLVMGEWIGFGSYDARPGSEWIHHEQ